MAGAYEIIFLIGLALLLFGPNKVPELARALGKATTEYKRGIKEAKQSILQDDVDTFSPEERELIREAKKLGIPTENRSIEEIANDIINS